MKVLRIRNQNTNGYYSHQKFPVLWNSLNPHYSPVSNSTHSLFSCIRKCSPIVIIWKRVEKSIFKRTAYIWGFVRVLCKHYFFCINTLIESVGKYYIFVQYIKKIRRRSDTEPKCSIPVLFCYRWLVLYSEWNEYNRFYRRILRKEGCRYILLRNTNLWIQTEEDGQEVISFSLWLNWFLLILSSYT